MILIIVGVVVKLKLAANSTLSLFWTKQHPFLSSQSRHFSHATSVTPLQSRHFSRATSVTTLQTRHFSHDTRDLCVEDEDRAGSA